MEDHIQLCPFTQFTYKLLNNNELNQTLYHLQHNSGFNINIIFYLLWVAKSQYGRLTKRQIKQCENEISVWHQQVIAELKYTHALILQYVSPKALQIKEAIQKEIVKAHLIEQYMLYSTRLKTPLLNRNHHQQLLDACMSLIHYCQLKNDLLIDDDQVAFNHLFSIVFDNLSELEIKKEIQMALREFKILASKANYQMSWREF